MKIFASIYKEWLVFRRDLAGVLVLLLMPAALIIIMSLVQDAPFRDFRDAKFELLVADEDGGSISKEIIDGLRKSGRFTLGNSATLSTQGLKQKLREGQYHVGVIIPKGATAALINSTNHLANMLSGTKSLPERARNDSLSISIVFDPAAKPAFRSAIQFALERYINSITSNILVQRMARLSGAQDVDPAEIAQPTLPIREAPLDELTPIGARLNSVQHNVPAWAIFGMFFIVITIAGQIIRERDEGSALRVQLIPGATAASGLGKIIFYTLVCSLQALLMGLLGIYLMPSFGLPALTLGEHPALIAVIVPFIGFAATAYGFAIGSLFRTANQALPFGAISMVMLSAIGGIWVPVEILPPLMQKVSVISPLHWSLDAVQQVIIRNRGIRAIIPDLAGLLIFGLAAWGLSFLNGKKAMQSGRL